MSGFFLNFLAQGFFFFPWNFISRKEGARPNYNNVAQLQQCGTRKLLDDVKHCWDLGWPVLYDPRIGVTALTSLPCMCSFSGPVVLFDSVH